MAFEPFEKEDTMSGVRAVAFRNLLEPDRSSMRFLDDGWAGITRGPTVYMEAGERITPYRKRKMKWHGYRIAKEQKLPGGRFAYIVSIVPMVHPADWPSRI
ncbi:MAG: hypothetical protein MPK75_01545 [Alphaproteobacteria bacterium]|nr:hypothetical protein [Alphaproteobacteria bacterium]